MGPQGLTSLLTQDDLFWFLFYKREKQLSYLPLVFGIFLLHAAVIDQTLLFGPVGGLYARMYAR